MTMEVYDDRGFNLPVATLRTRSGRPILPWFSAICFGFALGVFSTYCATPTPALRCATLSVVEAAP